MKLIKSGLNFLQACQELSTTDDLYISRKAWDFFPYERYEELDDCYYDDEGKKYIEIDTWDKHLCSFYDDGFSSSDEIVLKIDDVLARDWEVWENE